MLHCHKDVEEAFATTGIEIHAAVNKLADTLGALGLKGTIRTLLEIDSRLFGEHPEEKFSLQTASAYESTRNRQD